MGAVTPAIKDFLSQASRFVWDENGGHLIEGKNPNIVIYETEFDHKFLKGVRDIDDNSELDLRAKKQEFIINKNAIKQEIASITDLKNCDIGEYAMEQVAREVRKNSDVFLVSDDNKHLNERDQATSGCALNQISSSDFLVGTTSTYGFVNTELSKRGQEIKKKLEQQYGSLGVKNITWNTVQGDIESAGLHNGNYPDSLCVGSKAGHRGMNHGKSLEDHIAYGVSLQNNPNQISSEKTMPSVIEQALPQIIEIPYQETFGYKIGFHRMNRRMSEGDLAEAVKKIIETQNKEVASRDYLNSDRVKDWERNIELPDKEHYEAIVKVLVDENDKIVDDDKEIVRKAFAAAYELSTRARMSGSEAYKGDHNQGLFAFANVLSQYREVADLTEGKFAELLRKQLKFDIEEKPEEINAEMMLNIGGSGYVPSFGLVRAMVKALDAKKELTPEEKQEIFDAYSVVKEKRVLAQSLAKGSTPELDALKDKMFELFTEGGKQATMQEISYAAELNPAFLSRIFGKSSVDSSTEKTLRKRQEKLADALFEMTQDDDKVTRFNALFESFIHKATKERGQERGKI